MEDVIYVCFVGGMILLAILAIGGLIANCIPSRYPDGKCYLCRRGRCYPRDICPKCGTEQP